MASEQLEFRELRLPRFDPEIEERFQAEYRRWSLPLVRVSIPLGVPVYLSFFLWDCIQPGFGVVTTFSVRLAFAIFAGTVYALTFTSLFDRYAQRMLVLVILAAALGVELILYRLPNGFIAGTAGICLTVMYGCTLFTLQFRTAAVFVGLMLVSTNFLILSGSQSQSTVYVLINSNFFLISFGITGVAFTYVNEHSLPTRFRETGSVSASWLPWTRNRSRPGPPPRLRVFMCYRRAESADVVGRLHDRLAQRLGPHAIVKDVDVVPLGTDYRAYLGRMIKQCNVFLVVIGKEWLNQNNGGRRRIDDDADPVRAEIELAFNLGIRVVPVLIHQATMPAADELPESLKQLAYCNAATMRPDPDFHQDVDRLLNDLAAEREKLFPQDLRQTA